MFPDAPSFEHLFDAHIDLEVPEDIGVAPYGRRSVHIVRDGVVEGPRINGRVRAGGGDWLLTSESHHELDVRGTIETDDGALVYLSYRGVLKVTPEVMRRVLEGEDVDASEFYFRTTPRFETGHEKYAWLNTTVAVGYGRFGAQKVAYRVFAVL
jgi:hypothetical protein